MSPRADVAAGAPGDRTVGHAVDALCGPGVRPSEATGVPAAPGLYALHAAPAVWVELGLGAPADGRPLYVGKSERSLRGRDLGTHFATGRTGSSTLRRSLAALLHERLELRACPRNPARPDRFANYGLERAGDQRLTGWMAGNLTVAVWVPTEPCVLGEVETRVLRALLPPLNLDKVQTPWSADLKHRRGLLADQARSRRPAT